MAFDGRVLHGVIPGAGASAQPARRRVTFMVAFWASCQTRGAAEDGPGAARAKPLEPSTLNRAARVLELYVVL